MLKLQRYNGTDSLDTFLRKSHSMSWNEEDTMYHLCGSLEKAAGQVLWNLGKPSKIRPTISPRQLSPVV